jgi:hypothetical protein
MHCADKLSFVIPAKDLNSAIEANTRGAAVARSACQRLTNSQGPGAWSKGLEGTLTWLRALFPLRCRPASQSDPSPRGAEEARDTRLSRKDALREAALSLSLGDGIPFTGRDYLLLEQLWRTDP